MQSRSFTHFTATFDHNHFVYEFGQIEHFNTEIGLSYQNIGVEQFEFVPLGRIYTVYNVYMPIVKVKLSLCLTN
jgi:hypothetical protein